MEAIVFSIVVLVAVLVFIGLMGYEVYKETKTDLELKLRQHDSKLQTFFYEMNNDRNDGWSKALNSVDSLGNSAIFYALKPARAEPLDCLLMKAQN